MGNIIEEDLSDDDYKAKLMCNAKRRLNNIDAGYSNSFTYVGSKHHRIILGTFDDDENLYYRSLHELD